MIGLTTARANAVLDSELNSTYLGFFTTAPDANGTSGVECDYTSYARVAVTWASASARSKANSAVAQCPLKTGGADDTVVAWGLFDAASAGNLKCWGRAVGTPKSFVALASNTITCPAHTWTDDQPVILMSIPGESLPSGVTEGTVYYLISVTTDTFQISATVGGSAVDIGNGRGLVGDSMIAIIHDAERPQIASGELVVTL